MQQISQSIYDRFGIQIKDLPFGHQKALYFLRVLQNSGDKMARTKNSPFVCLEVPSVSIEEYYLILAHITEFPPENTIALSVLIERIQEACRENQIALTIDQHTIHK